MSASTRLRLIGALLAATAPLLLEGCARQMTEQSSTENFVATATAGHWVKVRDLNGSVVVHAGQTDRVRITALKRWSGDGDSGVKLLVNQDRGGDVTICAAWNGSSCSSHGDFELNFSLRQLFRHRAKASMDLDVEVPAGVLVDAQTVNGGVRIAGVTEETRAETVNGTVRIEGSGDMRGEAVNGDVVLRSTGPGDVRGESVNGSVDVELPATTGANVRMSTVNGGVSSEFPLTLTDELADHHARGTINGGGRLVRLETVNGSVRLRRIAEATVATSTPAESPR